MDAGVAGVLGAAIGGGLAVITAVGTSWFQLRMAKVQSQAQQLEAARERRFQAITERRVPRQKAYEDFLDISHRIEELFEDLPEWSVHKHLWRELPQRGATVAVVGPEAVAEAAQTAIDTFTLALFRHGRDDHAEHTDTIAPVRAFAAAARRALEDDGNDISRGVDPTASDG
ncbi:hypothetical protein ABZX65_26080 [Streptomyces sp. NPDC003300]|uniref:hypothetical protein n=1 Tax=unclassified Streptomyces TaxID=2593676 RepID=UPI0033A886D9